MRYILIVSLFILNLVAQIEMPLDFKLFKKGNGEGNTFLVIGGIQGDEPGGFITASLLATHYKITKGNLWVVPNLNFRSIIKNARGDEGDMNRKFAHIEPNDPDFESVQKIKEIILDKSVDVVLNMHDGSGFYRPTFEDDLNNPKRWGQSCIIDQSKIDNPKFGNLEEIANRVANRINSNTQMEKYKYRVKNTNTALGDKEMEKSLTYFAIKNNKPAFANESSKDIDINWRVYYQLLAVEAYMNEFGIEFERNFNLRPLVIQKILKDDIRVSFFGNKILLNLADAKSQINYLPFKKGVATIEASSINPLVNVIKNRDMYNVSFGNRKLTTIKPLYFDYDNSLNNLSLEVDGQNIETNLGEVIQIKDSVMVKLSQEYRINIIGFDSKLQNESNMKIYKRDIQKKFSIDKEGNLYRMEIYKGNKFSGMILLDFKQDRITQLKESKIYKNQKLANVF